MWWKILAILGLLGTSWLLQRESVELPVGAPASIIETEVRDWYYSLPKVIPGTNGSPIVDGYDGRAVRWDGKKEIYPLDLIDELNKKLRDNGLEEKDTEAEEAKRLRIL